MMNASAELRDVLKDLVLGSGALAAEIATEDVIDDTALTAALGGGARLIVWPLDGADREGLRAAVERGARALRACLRRHGETTFPALRYTREVIGLTQDRIRDRIQTYLRALVATPGAHNAVITVDRETIAEAYPLDDLQHDRLNLVHKQVDAEVERRKGETSHVEVLVGDVGAFGFWVKACLVVYIDDSCAPDFLRHRARLVMREVSQLLPHLDEPPADPAHVAPIPE